jgi:hypothetical protein
MSSRIFRSLGSPVSLYAIVGCSVVALALMWLESPAATLGAVRRLHPIIVLTGATVATTLITAVRLPTGGLHYALSYPIAPACWVAAGVLGLAASRRRVFPLVVAGVSVWASAIAALVDLSARAGLSTPVGVWYEEWSRAVRASVPGPGESFRTAGLEVDPNAFGLIGMVALVFALTLEGSSRSRAVIAAGAFVVLAMSGSRTAAVSVVVACVAWLAPSVGNWSGLRGRARQLGPALVGVLVAGVVLLAASAGAGTAVGVAGRLAASTAALSQPQGAGVSGAVDAATSGRLAIWTSTLQAYAAHPAGAFYPPELLVGRSVHNEYLETLLWGGPILVAAFLYLLWWLFVKVRPAEAPAFGPAMGAAYGCAALALGVSMQSAFLGMAFYLVGWMCGQRVGPAVARGSDATSLQRESTSADSRGLGDPIA